MRESLAHGRKRKTQVSGIQNFILLHAVLEGARLVIAEGRRGCQKGAPLFAIDIKDGANGRINTVKGFHVAGRDVDGRRIRLVQAGIFRVGRVGIGRQAANGLNDFRARANRVFIKVEAQHGPPPFKRSNIGLKLFDFRLGLNHNPAIPCFRRPLHKMRQDVLSIVFELGRNGSRRADRSEHEFIATDCDKALDLLHALLG